MSTHAENPKDIEILRYVMAPDLDPLFWHEERAEVPSGWHGHVPFAHWIIGACKPRIFVELGTHYGVSYYAFCEAVSRNKLDTRCFAIDTWQGDDQAGFYGEEVLEDVRRFHDGRYSSFSELLRCSFDDALPYFSDGSVDLLHVDGLHTYEAVSHDFEVWRPKLSDRGVVLFHDTNVRERGFGVWRLWEELRRQFSGFEFLHGSGLGVLAVGSAVASPLAALCSLTDKHQVTTIRERFAFLGEHSILLNRCGTLREELETQRKQLSNHLAQVKGELEQRSLQIASTVESLRSELAAKDAHLSATTATVQRLDAVAKAAEAARHELTAQLQGARQACAASEEEMRHATLRYSQVVNSLTWRAARPFHQLAGRFPLTLRTRVYNLLVQLFGLAARIERLLLKRGKGVGTLSSPTPRPTGANQKSTATLNAAKARRPIALRELSCSSPPMSVQSINGRSRMLCVTHVLPYPPRAGNEHRIHRMLGWLSQNQWEIMLVVCPLPNEPVTGADVTAAAEIYPNLIVCNQDGTLFYRTASDAAMLQGLSGKQPGAFSSQLDQIHSADEKVLTILRTFCPDLLIEVLLYLESKFDPQVLLAEYVFMTYPFALLRPNLFKVVDVVEVFSTTKEKVMRYGIDQVLELEPNVEARLLSQADLLIAIQQEEERVLRNLTSERQVITVGIDFAVQNEPPPPAAQPVVLLVASRNPMNVKGIKDFLRFAWRLVQRDLPDAELWIIGSVGEVIDAAPTGVKILGRVQDLTPAYANARVVINPAIGGTGLKIKTIEAISHLRPIVCWPSGVEGVDGRVKELCHVATNWFDFACRVIRLASQEDGARPLITKRAELARYFAAESVYAPLGKALEGVGTRSAK